MIVKKQEDEVEPTYLEIRKIIEDGMPKYSDIGGLLDRKVDEEIAQENSIYSAVQGHLMLLIIEKLFLLKSSAFQEELEWRLISHFIPLTHDCSYRYFSDRVIPCRKFEFLELERNPIVEIVLGPKHVTPIRIVEDFVRRNGFKDVRVRRSDASYR